MDAAQFDRVTRQVATMTRRSALWRLGALPLVGALVLREATAPALAGKGRDKNDDKKRNNKNKKKNKRQDPLGANPLCPNAFQTCYRQNEATCTRLGSSCCDLCTQFVAAKCSGPVETGTICGNITVRHCDHDEGNLVCCYGRYSVDASIGCK